MAKFRRVFSHLLRLHPKYRQSLHQGSVATSTADTAVAYREPSSLRREGHTGLESTVQDVGPSIDGIPEDLKEFEESEHEHEVSIAVEVQSVEPLLDTTPENIEDAKEYDGERDRYIPEVFPYDLVRKTHNEMMAQRLYVAVVDDDCEAAALRNLYREKFTHIVRVAFNPLSRHGNITPSSWTSEEICADDGPHEMRLTCPALSLHYGGKLTALTEKQLLAARNYITRTLPHRNDTWAERGLEFPFSPDECKDARVLIVGTTGRSVDVMVILVCYMSFLTEQSADQVLAELRKQRLVHSYWGSDILGKDSLNMANEVSKRKWKW